MPFPQNIKVGDPAYLVWEYQRYSRPRKHYISGILDNGFTVTLDSVISKEPIKFNIINGDAVCSDKIEYSKEILYAFHTKKEAIDHIKFGLLLEIESYENKITELKRELSIIDGWNHD